MKCPHCKFEWEPRRTVRVQRSLSGLGPLLVALLLCMAFFTGMGLWVARGEMAVEIIPGVTHYGGHTSSVEIIPGVKQFSGAYEGTVTEIIPGVSSYNLRQPYHLEQSTNRLGENHVLPYPPAASRVLRDHPYGVAREPK